MEITAKFGFKPTYGNNMGFADGRYSARVAYIEYFSEELLRHPQEVVADLDKEIESALSDAKSKLKWANGYQSTGGRAEVRILCKRTKSFWMKYFCYFFASLAFEEIAWEEITRDQLLKEDNVILVVVEGFCYSSAYS